MKSYVLKLINKNKNLDLTQKSTEINNCLNEILNKRKGLNSFKLNKISKDCIILTVKEEDKWWHQTFGKLLANDYGMREFCSDRDSAKMFDWS